jgi:DNA-binding transcriptional ArsR family regulator
MTEKQISHEDPAVPGIETAAQGFAAVGSEPRLAVLLALVRAGPEGLTVGEIQDRLQVPASTLAHHLRALAAAGLLEQEKRGREVRNRAAFRRIEALAGYLLRECCSEAPAAVDGDQKGEYA